MDSSDLNLAKQISRLLKISIFGELFCSQFEGCQVNFITVHGKEPLPTLDASEVQEVRKELIAIRDKVNTLLDAIDGAPKATSSQDVSVVEKQTSSRPTVDTTTKTEGKDRPCAPNTHYPG